MILRISNFLSLLTIALLFSGCVASQKVVKQHPFLKLEKKDIEITSSILKMIKDPVAESLVTEALENNNNLKSSAMRLKSSKLLLAESRADMSPEVKAGYSFSRDNQSLVGRKEGSNHKVSLSVSWEIDIWGRLADMSDSERQRHRALELDYTKAVDSLGARVIQSYIYIKSSRMKIEELESRVDLAKSIKISVIGSYRAGFGSLADISSAKRDVQLAMVSLEEEKSTFKDRVRELEVLMGRRPEGILKFEGGIPEVSPPSSVDAVLLSNRPDVSAAFKRYESAVLSSSASDKARLPNIIISADIFRDNRFLGKLGASDNSWGVLGNLLYPLFDRGRLKARSEASRKEAEAAYYDMAETVLQALKEAEKTFSVEDKLKNQMFHLGSAMKSAKKSTIYYKKRYMEGLENLITLQNAKDQQSDTAISIIDNRTERVINRIDMALALGVGVGGER